MAVVSLLCSLAEADKAGKAGNDIKSKSTREQTVKKTSNVFRTHSLACGEIRPCFKTPPFREKFIRGSGKGRPDSVEF